MQQIRTFYSITSSARPSSIGGTVVLTFDDGLLPRYTKVACPSRADHWRGARQPLVLTLLSGLKSGARTLPPCGEPGAMDKLLFWLGLGAAQKGAGSKPLDGRNRALSFAVGTLLALLIAVGMFILLVSQK